MRACSIVFVPGSHTVDGKPQGVGNAATPWGSRSIFAVEY